MGVPKLKKAITVKDYLEAEKIAPARHEYVDGEIYVMAGTTIRHNRIVRELVRKISDGLDGTDCEVLFEQIKLRLENPDRFYYPDLVVVCGEEEDSEDFITKPKLIVEVLSPSTAMIDRREKMFAYKELASVVEYVLVDQEQVYAEVYRRRVDGYWDWIEFDAAEEIELASIGLKTPLIGLYPG